MKLLIDRSEIDKALKQAKEDGNISEGFERAKVKAEDVKKKILEDYFGDEEEQETALRQAIVDLYGEQ